MRELHVTPEQFATVQKSMNERLYLDQSDSVIYGWMQWMGYVPEEFMFKPTKIIVDF